MIAKDLETRKRVASLSSAIFNGRNTAKAVKININNTGNNDKNISVTAEILLLNLDFKNGELTRATDLPFDPVNNNFIFSNSPNCSEDFLCFKYNASLQDLFLSDITSKESDFVMNIRSDGDFDYTAKATEKVPFTDHEASMNKPYLNAYNMRYLGQEGIIPGNVTTLLIIFPNASALPLIIGYIDNDIDYSKILLSEDKHCIFTNFNDNFDYKVCKYIEGLPCSFRPDSEFHKATTVIDAQKSETLKEYTIDPIDSDSIIERYEYDSEYIFGSLGKNSINARFFLKGKNHNYVLMSTNEDYFTSPEAVKSCRGSVEIKGEERNKIIDKLLEYFNYRIFIENDIKFINKTSEFYSERVTVYNDDLSADVYHIIYDNDVYIDFTVFGEEYILINRLASAPIDKSNIWYDTNLIAIDVDKKDGLIISYSTALYKVSDNSYKELCYAGQRGDIRFNSTINQLNTTPSMNPRKKNSPIINDAKIIKTIDYSSNEIEIFKCREILISPDNSVYAIDKFSSVLYSYNNINDIIVRNYLGLPVNVRYLTAIH